MSGEWGRAVSSRSLEAVATGSVSREHDQLGYLKRVGLELGGLGLGLGSGLGSGLGVRVILFEREIRESNAG